MDSDPSLFYTGLVSELYSALRSADPDPEPYARFVARYGEPALELGCGDGDPLLELRSRGLQVEGLDSSPDMLARCRSRAAELGVTVVLHESWIEEMALPLTYRSIFVAGPTFNLIPDDGSAALALGRIAAHLDTGGSVLIPLFIPATETVGQLGRTRSHESADGSVMRFTPVSSERHDDDRVLTTVLRYELDRDGVTTVLEREWLLHWYDQSTFRSLAEDAGLEVAAVMDYAGQPAGPDATEFVFLLTNR